VQDLIVGKDGCATLVLLSLKSSVDVSVTRGGGGSAATAHAETVGGACVHNNAAVVNLDCRRAVTETYLRRCKPSAWLLLGLDSDKQKLTIN